MSHARELSPETLHAIVRSVWPEAEVAGIRAFGDDEATGGGDATAKGLGYGRPVRVELTGGDAPSSVVVHTARPGPFGHERRADRAQELVLAFDTFGAVPRHVRALAVGAFSGGRPVALDADAEPFLVTEYVPGVLYADRLRAIARRAAVDDADLADARTLGSYLADLHRAPADPGGYRRSVRDVVGHGEGVFGLVDAYPEDAPAAPPSRLRAIEEGCARWRWRLRDRDQRARRVHGDFHPFNLLLDDGALHLLDASRGCLGDPADDVTCLAINYPFFALAHPGAWEQALSKLWRAFWDAYLESRDDPELFEAAPLYWTWRTLVLAHPRWYPDVSAAQRDALLTTAERMLDRGRLDLAELEERLP